MEEFPKTVQALRRFIRKEMQEAPQGIGVVKQWTPQEIQKKKELEEWAAVKEITEND